MPMHTHNLKHWLTIQRCKFTKSRNCIRWPRLRKEWFSRFRSRQLFRLLLRRSIVRIEIAVFKRFFNLFLYRQKSMIFIEYLLKTFLQLDQDQKLYHQDFMTSLLLIHFGYISIILVEEFEDLLRY